MVLSTEWTQVEVIELVNDGSGLGFGIVGGKSTGVVIKSILPGGLADKDGRLQSGDHILQIGDVNVRGFSSEHVATVLRASGAEVRMVIGRPVEPSSSDFRNFATDAPVVPTKIVINPDDLDYHLVVNGYEAICDIDFDIEYYREINELNDDEEEEGGAEEGSSLYNGVEEYEQDGYVEGAGGDGDVEGATFTTGEAQNLDDVNVSDDSDDIDEAEVTLPETEKFTVDLDKNECGLGITIAGYVCEREDLSGIFVKGISAGSQAAKCCLIATNDRIVAVDGVPLHGLTNYAAVERLKRAGDTVQLTFERYLRGPKYEGLQQAIASQRAQVTREDTSSRVLVTVVKDGDGEEEVGEEELVGVIQQVGLEDISPVSPSVTTLSWIPIETEIPLEGEGDLASITSEILSDVNPEQREIFVDERFEGDPNADVETTIRKKWKELIGCETDVVVAHLTKLKGLGISLEGTVDVEHGIEVRPHHYIRSILPEGPVGQNGKLNSGDELLEVNGQKLLGIRHVDVVQILKELPSAVRLVCARPQTPAAGNRVINTSQDREGFLARNILGGSLKNLLVASGLRKGEELEEEGSEEELLCLECLEEDDREEVNEERKGEAVVIDSVEEEIELETSSITPTADIHHNSHDTITEQFSVNKSTSLRYITILPGDCPACDESLTPTLLDNTAEKPNHLALLKSLSDTSINNPPNNNNNHTASTVTITDEVVTTEDTLDVESALTVITTNTPQVIKSQSLDETSLKQIGKLLRKNTTETKSMGMWSSDIEYIDLTRTDRGLGFSILDYQDPVAGPGGTVIVVRALIPHGAAVTDGRIEAGDRLVSVNGRAVRGDATLDDAVQMLKGTALGVVRLGIAKPAVAEVVVEEDEKR